MQDSSEEPVQFAAQRIVRSSPEDFMVEIKLRGFYSKARVLSDVIEETYKLVRVPFPPLPLRNRKRRGELEEI